ncbi:MAG TPA: hypothetical protein VL098_01565 [Flavipsychrobacter sp.]|nr:hypothetical protein [Flavipsychrobacter sp.]
MNIYAGCFVILLFTGKWAAAQHTSPVDPLYGNEEYETITTLYEQRAADFSEMDSVQTARSYLLQQKTEKARQLFYALYTHHPDHTGYLIQLLNASNTLYHYSFIYTTAIRALTEQKHHKAIYHYAVIASKKLDRKEEAFEYALKGQQLFPSDPRLTLDLATELQERSLYDSSLTILLPVLAKDTGQLGLLEKAVKAYYMQNEFKNAVILANYLLSRDIYSNTVLIYQLYSYYEAKQYKSTVDLVGRLLQADQYSAGMLLVGAKAAAALKNYTLSNEWLYRGREELTDKQDVAFLHQLAENAAAQRQFDLAAKFYDTSIYIYRMPFSYYLKGVNYMEAGKKELAIRQFDRYKTHPLVRKDTTATNQKILKYINSVSR